MLLSEISQFVLESGLTQKALEALLTKGLPMLAVYWLLNRPVIQGWFERLEPWFLTHWDLKLSVVKRVTAILASVVLFLIAFAVYAALGYAPWPAGFEGWADLVLQGFLVFAGSQVVHLRDLNKKE